MDLIETGFVKLAVFRVVEVRTLSRWRDVSNSKCKFEANLYHLVVQRNLWQLFL